MTNRKRGRFTARLPWGAFVTADSKEAIGYTIWCAGLFELAVSEVLARLVEPGSWVVDVGANIGQMSLIMGLRAGPNGRLSCFEPHTALFAQLSENLQRAVVESRFADLDLRNSALSEHAGTALLTLPDDFEGNAGLASLAIQPTGNARTLPVMTERLDDVIGAGTVSVMKLDVEGHERAVLLGAREALASHRIRHLVYEDFVGTTSEVARLLVEHGYELFRLGWRMRGPVMEPVGNALSQPPHADSNYLATCDPRGALSLCEPRGWRVFRRNLDMPGAPFTAKSGGLAT